jgi:GT2 family glycosyltransferase
VPWVVKTLLEKTALSLTNADQLVVYAVVVTWNEVQDTVASIDSLLDGTRPPDQIVVVDNGSEERLITQLRQVCGGKPDVTLIENDANQGYARAANIGIRHALRHSVDAVLLINNDAVLTEEALEILLEAVRQEDSFGLFGPRILYYDEPDLIWEGGGYYFILKRGVIGHEKKKRVRDCSDENREVTYLTGCVLLVRSCVFEEIGLLDEGFFMYAEDPDFCFRARKAGGRLLYVPRAQAMHKVPVRGTRRLSRLALYHSGHSQVLLLRKHFSGVFLISGLLAHLFLHGPYTFLQLLRGAGSARDFRWWLRGTWDGMLGRTATEQISGGTKGHGC